MAITHAGTDWIHGRHVHRWTGLVYTYVVTLHRGITVTWDAAIQLDGVTCGHIHGQLMGLQAEADELRQYIASVQVEPAIDSGRI